MGGTDYVYPFEQIEFTEAMEAPYKSADSSMYGSRFQNIPYTRVRTTGYYNLSPVRGDDK